MAFNYSFTTSPGFATNDNITLIQSDIESSITTILLDIKAIGDCIEIEFDSQLSQEDETLLHALITNRDNSVPKTFIKIYYPEISNVSTTYYKNIGEFSFKGCKVTGDLKGVDIISYQDNGLTSYTIEIINRSDNSIVCNATLTNTNTNINTLSIVTQPTEPCILQVAMKIQKSPTNYNVLYGHVKEIILWN